MDIRWFCDMMKLPKPLLIYFLAKENRTSKIKEFAPSASDNSRYVAALGVYEEFLRSAEYINGEEFRPWLKACLNPPKAADCA